MDKHIFYSRKEASKKLNLTERAVDKLISKGNLMSFKYKGRVLISDKQLNDYTDKKSILYTKI